MVHTVPQATYPGLVGSEPLPSCPLFGLAPSGVYHPRVLPHVLVGSYSTVSPLLLAANHRHTTEAVYFLWHFPSPLGAWALPSTLLYGVRTFLDVRAAIGARAAITLRTLPRPSDFSSHGRLPYIACPHAGHP